MKYSNRIFIWGKFPLDNIDTKCLTEKIVRWGIGSGETPRIIYYANIHQLRLFDENQDYRRAVNRADLVYPDGIGAVIAGGLCGYRMNGRSTANDFYTRVFEEWGKRKVRIFLLGGKKNVVELAKIKLELKFENLIIVGTQHGYFHSSKVVNKLIRRCRPEVILVGMGSPKQEIWIEENEEKLKGLNLVWAVGGLFNYLSGDWVRAPKPFLITGTEWLFRFITEPAKMIPRYLKGLYSLFGQTATYWLRNSFFKKRSRQNPPGDVKKIDLIRVKIVKKRGSY